MKDKHAWIIYEDFSKRAKENRAWRSHVDEDYLSKYTHWIPRTLPLLVTPLFHGAFCIYFLGKDALKMFVFGLIPFTIIMGILGLTKLYDYLTFGRHSKAHRKAVQLKKTSDDYFVQYVEDKAVKRHYKLVELLGYIVIVGMWFGFKTTLIGLSLYLPAIIAWLLLLFVVRVKLPKMIHG